jgi:hypothetical protein
VITDRWQHYNIGVNVPSEEKEEDWNRYENICNIFIKISVAECWQGQSST